MNKVLKRCGDFAVIYFFFFVDKMVRQKLHLSRLTNIFLNNWHIFNNKAKTMAKMNKEKILF